MSAKATAWAWDQAYSGTAKLVLLCLADSPDATVLQMSKMTGASLKTLRQTLTRLEKDGVIASTEHSVSPPGYALVIDGGGGE